MLFFFCKKVVRLIRENWCLFKKMRASKCHFLSNSDWGAFENDKYPNVIDGCVDDIVQPLMQRSIAECR